MNSKPAIFLLVLLIITFTFFVLDQENKSLFKKKPEITDQMKLDTLRSQGLKTGETTNDIFLDLLFGDSERTVLRKLKSNARNKKINIESGKYVYYIETGGPSINKIRITFSAEYYKNKLYEFTLKAEPESELDIYPISYALVAQKLMGLYYNKYGFPQATFENDEHKYEYYWLENNREIKIYNIDIMAFVVYTDNNILKEKEVVEKSDDQKRIEQSKKKAMQDL